MTKRIVVDFDDTLCFSINRDYANGSPNKALITKLNSLYDLGWEISIVTARGQLSCDGNTQAAEIKYRDDMQKWLILNNMKYTNLSFEKKYADYYIDDKGIKPEEFLNLVVDKNE